MFASQFGIIASGPIDSWARTSAGSPTQIRKIGGGGGAVALTLFSTLNIIKMF